LASVDTAGQIGHLIALYFTKILAPEAHISIGIVGAVSGHALIEAINALFKTDCTRTSMFRNGPFTTIADVAYTTAG